MSATVPLFFVITGGPGSGKTTLIEALASDVQAYDARRCAAGPVFFDRGIPDVVGYLRLQGFAVPAPMLHAAATLRYQPRVFICPPWPDIYATDSERRQSLEIAERTYRAMVDVYTELGYALVDMPRVNTEERVRFVRDVVEASDPT